MRVYESGAEWSETTKRFVKAPPQHAITPQNAHVFKLKRQEKTSRLLRERITQAHNDNMPVPANGSAEAFAESGAMLYENVVLNTDAYPRDRLEVWEKLGKYAAVLPADIRAVDTDANPAPAVVNNVVNNTIIQILQDVAQAQSASSSNVVDADVQDAG